MSPTGFVVRTIVPDNERHNSDWHTFGVRAHGGTRKAYRSARTCLRIMRNLHPACRFELWAETVGAVKQGVDRRLINL